MAKTVVKRKLNKSKLFTVLFAVLFVVSLFMSINAFAETTAFKITSATLSDKSDGVTGTITSFTDDKVINNIEFHKLNDSVTYKMVIKSNLSREITILDITDDNENSFIDYEYDKHENEKVSANGTLNFDVKAIYKTLVNDITKRNQNNTVKFTIKYLDEGEKKTDEIIINPKTGDSIHISYIMLIISSIGLITSLATSKKKKKALNMMLIGLITLPVIAKAASTLTFDLSLVSTYKLNDKIVVTLDDGTTETTKAINYGGTIDSLPSPIVAGYHIDKWVNEDNTDFDITAPIYEDKTVTASWKANPYTIHFNINDTSIVVDPGTTLITDGSMEDLEMVYDTSKALTSNGFTIQGYAFDSWNTKADGTGTKIEDGATVNNLAESGIVNLYARWGATPYTVNYDINTPDPNATGTTASQSKPYNTTFTLSPNGFTRTGYNFYGWNTESDGSGTHYDDEESVKNLDIDGEITLYAQWGPKSISITFDKNTDDTHVTGTMTNQTVTYDVNTYLKQNAYVRPGYTFLGWNIQSDGLGNHYDNQENITNEFVNNTTLYAEWDVNDYRIVFKKNDDRATGGMSPQTITYDTTVNLDQLGFELTGYNFVEWNTEEDGSGTSYSDQAEVTNLITSGELELYAIWEPKQYTITYDINTDDPNATGTMSAQVIVYDVQNTKLNENQYTRTGYAFAGWNTLANGQGTHYDDKQDVTNTISENDITLYAEWAVTPYTVIFNPNYTTTEQIHSQQIAYGVEANLNANTYIREHYKFLGWNTLANGTGTHYDDGQKVKNLDIDGEVNLYAEWIESTATLQTGSNVNTLLKSVNSNATAFKHYTGAPDFDSIDGEVDIALSTSNFPVYAWNDNETIYWWSEAEDVFLNGDSSHLFQNLTSITDIELENLDSINVNDMSFMFDGCSSIEEIDVTPLNTSNVTNMYAMFAHMTNLSSLDVSSFEMSNVENVQSFAAYGQKLTELDLSSWDTSNFKNIKWIVRDSAVKKLNLSGWNTNKVEIFGGFSSFFSSVEELDLSNWTNMNFTDMSNWFGGASNFKKINFTNFNTSEVKNMANMFNGTTGLTTLDLSSFNTSKVKDMSLMFYNDKFTTLDISNFNTSSLENMYGMFAGLKNIEKLDLSMFNTSNVTNMRSVFNGSTIKELDLSSWNTSRVENMWMMFEFCSSLEKIYVGSQWTTDNVTNSASIFNGTSNLVGGSGTTWNSSMTHDKSYARIDDPDNGKPGLFTDIADKPISP